MPRKNIIDETTHIPLGIAASILISVMTGVCGGAMWATRMDVQLQALRASVTRIEDRLGIVKVQRLPSSHPWVIPEAIAGDQR